MSSGRIVGLDFGDRRIGVAVSDPTAFLASPRGVIEYRDIHVAKKAVAALCREVDASRIVIGLPLNMDGSEGPAVEKVRAFIELLRSVIEVPIETWDERLTTKSAHDVLIEAGTRREKRKGLVDKLAAQFILQGYLDARTGPAPEPFDE